jgi:polysaccharide export outer membrane protein
MKSSIKVWTISALMILASWTFAAAQQDKEKGKTGEKPSVENPGKNIAEKPNNEVLVAESASETPNPYKNQASDKYRIGFQDTVSIEVFRHPELTRQVNVNPDGTIRMPRINEPIIAVCKTENELENTITAYYKTYLKDPFVTVRALEQKSQPVAVVGAVQKPGNFYLNRKVRLLELISLAGGPDVEFAGTRVQVARLGNLSGCQDANEKVDEEKNVEFVGYKLNDILTGRANPWMQPGDIVSILMAEEAYVVGNVLKPTKVVMKEPMTLTQALAAAGGINKTAKTDKVIIQRQGDNGSKTSLSYNLKDIVSQKIPDPQLQGNDIVQVDTDKMKGIVEGVKGLFKTALPAAVYAIP